MDFSRLTSYTLISKGVFYLKVYETLNCRLRESERLHNELYYEKSLAESKNSVFQKIRSVINNETRLKSGSKDQTREYRLKQNEIDLAENLEFLSQIESNLTSVRRVNQSILDNKSKAVRRLYVINKLVASRKTDIQYMKDWPVLNSPCACSTSSVLSELKSYSSTTCQNVIL